MSPGGLGETWAKLHINCVTLAAAGLYECRGVAGAKEVVVTTMVEVVEHTAQQSCIDRSEVGPTIAGWFSHMMVQAGNTAKLPCELGVTYTHYI